MARPVTPAEAPEVNNTSRPESPEFSKNQESEYDLGLYVRTASERESVEARAGMEREHRLAHALVSISSDPARRDGIVKYGAFAALIRLARQPAHKTQLSCAKAFNNFASVPAYRNAMIEQGAVTAIVHVVFQNPGDRIIKKNCAQAIANLAATDSGHENDMIRDGAGQVLLNIKNSTASIKEVCLQGLINLSNVEKKYFRVDELNDGALQLVASFANMEQEARVMILQFICNLAAIKNNQASLVEHGAGRTLSKIAMSSTSSAQCKMLCILALSKLSECPHSRSKMSGHDQNVVPVLLRLSNEQDRDLQLQCAVAIGRFTLDVNCSAKIAEYHNIVSTLVHLSFAGFPNPELHRIFAAAFGSLSSVGEKLATNLVEEGVTVALANLLQHEDLATKMYCVQCICVLISYSRHVRTLGSVLSFLLPLVTIGNEDLARWCALAFNILSCNLQALSDESDAASSSVGLAENSSDLSTMSSIFRERKAHLRQHQQAVLGGSGDEAGNRPTHANIVAALVQLSDFHHPETRSNCAAALWNLTNQADCDADMLVPPLVKMVVRTDCDTAMRGDCAAALYNLARTPKNCLKMLEYDVLAPVLELCKVGPLDGAPDAVRHKKQCGAILLRLSPYKEKWDNADEVVEVLLDLARLDHEDTQTRSTIAMYNLSCNAFMRPVLLTERLMGEIARLSNRPDENMRRGCAAILCNLSSFPGSEELMVRCHAARVLLVIALVASDSDTTKEICAKALFNLLHDRKGHKSMVKMGVLHGLSTISKLAAPEVVELCATAFCNLSEEFFDDIVHTSCLVSLFSMLESEHASTRTRAMQTLVNLLIQSKLQHVQFHLKSIKHLRRLARREHHLLDPCPFTQHLLTMSTHVLSEFPHCCKPLIEAAPPQPVAPPAAEGGKGPASAKGGSRPASATAAEELKAAIEGTIPQTPQGQQGGRPDVSLFSALKLPPVDTIEPGSQEMADATSLATVLFRLAESPETTRAVIDEGAMSHLHDLSGIHDPGIQDLVLKTLAVLAQRQENLAKLTQQGVVEIMGTLLDTSRRLDFQRIFASTLYNLSCSEESCCELVNRGIVPYLVRVWQGLPGESRAAVDTGRVCALAITNFAAAKVNSARMVRDGATSILVCFATTDHGDRSLYQRCTAALRNLLTVQANHATMIHEGVIPALIKLAEFPLVDIQHNCATALRSLTYNKTSREEIIASGAIQVILDDTNRINAQPSEQIFNPKLLRELEAEAWSHASCSQTVHVKADAMPALPLVTQLPLGAVSGPDFDTRSFTIRTQKFTVMTELNEPSLQAIPEQKCKDKDKAPFLPLVRQWIADAQKTNQKDFSMQSSEFQTFGKQSVATQPNTGTDDDKLLGGLQDAPRETRPSVMLMEGRDLLDDPFDLEEGASSLFSRDLGASDEREERDTLAGQSSTTSLRGGLATSSLAFDSTASVHNFDVAAGIREMADAAKMDEFGPRADEQRSHAENQVAFDTSHSKPTHAKPTKPDKARRVPTPQRVTDIHSLVAVAREGSVEELLHGYAQAASTGVVSVNPDLFDF